jgi:large subunit ribosomal protein L30
VKPLLSVRQKASTIGQVEHMRKVIRGLGLRGLGTHVVVANTPSFRGMVKKVIHLVEVEEIDAGSEGAPGRGSRNPSAPAAATK